MTELAEGELKLRDGIYPGLSFEEYVNGDGWKGRLSGSTLLAGRVSMRHLRWAIDHPDTIDSDAKRLGRAYHMALLEPHLFDDCYAVEPEFQSTTGKPRTSGWKNTIDYKSQLAAWMDMEGHRKEIIAESRMGDIKMMRDSLYEHPVVELLRARGGYEVSVAWEDSGFGMKSRLDKYIAGDQGMPPTIVDLKKTRSLENNHLDRDCLTYGYAVKAYMYIRAIKQVAGRDADFIWIFQEDSQPYDVRVRQFDERSFQVAEWDYKSLMARYREAVDTNQWPGVSNNIERRCLPDWYCRGHESVKGVA